jgi:hypothetical protein
MEALLLLLIAILTLLFLVARAAARAGRNIARDMRAEAAVLNYLASHCGGALGEIAEATGLGEEEVAGALFRLMLKGDVEYDGVYRLRECGGR